MAVERSRERIKSLLPPQDIDAKDISDDGKQSPPQGKRRTLMTLLEREARKKPCSLDRLEEISTNEGLEWAWVEKQIESLANTGALIFPRPWTIQLVIHDVDDDETVGSSKDVSNEIVSLLRDKGGELSVAEIMDYFIEKGVSESSVENSLERLMRSGDIFQPKPRLVKII